MDITIRKYSKTYSVFIYSLFDLMDSGENWEEIDELKKHLDHYFLAWTAVSPNLYLLHGDQEIDNDQLVKELETFSGVKALLKATSDQVIYFKSFKDKILTEPNFTSEKEIDILDVTRKFCK